LEKGESIKAKVMFKDDSFFFKGHFPGRPIVPGVIIVESMAQVGGILIYKSFEDSSLGKDPALVGINNVRFKAPTLPNDTLIIEASLVKKKLNIFKISTKAFKDDKLIVEADITATVLS
jgi:3-hydroxymyristoyl/3-hydroxydecanoyl-(acyl carrier protein) dehydratase